MNYIFDLNGYASSLIADSAAFTNSIDAILAGHAGVINQWFIANPSVTNHTFVFETEQADYYSNEYDIGTSIQGAKVHLATSVSVKKTPPGILAIETLTVLGCLRDIYDYDYFAGIGAGDLTHYGGTLQAGYDPSRGRVSGRVFGVEIRLNKAFSNYPYSF